MRIYLVSACLLGLKTRYDGRTIDVGDSVRKPFVTGICIPVCPEQLGGLPTPRTPADLVGGDGRDVLAGRAEVVDRKGVNVTDNFFCGARQVLTIARQQKIARIFFKAESPSCGLHPRLGVTAAMLLAEGFEIVEIE